MLRISFVHPTWHRLDQKAVTVWGREAHGALCHIIFYNALVILCLA